MNPSLPLLLLASITVSFLAGSSAPTPLYVLYQSQWHFSATMVTVVFAVYALAVLAALLVAGRLSDHLGRRPVLLASIAIQLAAMGLFAFAQGLGELLAARAVQGLSAGAAIAAVGAGMLDLDRKHGTLANSLAPPIGTGLGAIVSGLLVRYLPYPTHLVYAVFAAIFVLQGLGVWLMAETHAPRPGALDSLRPRLGISDEARRTLVAAVPALVATWALAGFYASLGPALVRGLLGTSSILVGALSLFVLATSAALATFFLRDRGNADLAAVGAGALVAGAGIVIASLSTHSSALFFAGTAISGVGFGAGFQGAIRSVAARAASHERAAVLSIALIVAYLAMGLPAVAAGYAVTHYGDIVSTARGFGVLVITLAILSSASIARRRAAAPATTNS